MKNKIIFGFMLLIAGLFTACSDADDYGINTGALLGENSVVTGSADVTATSAVLHGSVSGLESQASSAYTTGFYYGFAADALTERVTANSDGEFSASISGMPNQNVFYQAFVTLQGRVTYTGEVKSLIMTNAKAATGDIVDLTPYTARLSGSLSEYPSDAKCGIVISSVEGEENVRAGVKVQATAVGDNYEVDVKGMLPGHKYYYAAYLDLGAGIVYGDVKELTTNTAPAVDVDKEFVDLGLSVKWAKKNIAAAQVTDLGGLFGFGDNAGYVTSIKAEDYASANIYRTATDLAYLTYEGKAMLPTADEYEELFRCCKTEWTEQDGVPGYKFTGPNGNSIFMPAAGSRTVSDFSGEGTDGRYMTGSVNPSDSRYSLCYTFNSAYNGRSSVPVYTAMSVRAVSVAKNVPFDKKKLCQKWYLDNGQDGKQHVFEGPFTQWGAHDTYGTVTNNEPNVYEQIHWEMGKDNSWIGYTYGKDYGYMEFLEDGTVNIHRIAEDGTVTDDKGKYTVDTKAKTITIDKDVLAANTWLGTKSGTLNILTLTDDQLQIALPAGDGTYAYSLNYYSEAKRQKDDEITVSLICAGSDYNGAWGSVVGSIAPSELDGDHTFVYEGACIDAMVFALDLQNMKSRFPNAIVTIKEMKCDGKAVKFDANNFCYGDIEDNGNFRVELFNVWGKGAVNGNVVASPFSSATNCASDPAFSFANKLEITYSIVKDGLSNVTPQLITINPSWGGTWGYNQGASFDVTIDQATGKYALTKNSFSIKYESSEHSAGSIMTFVQIDNWMKAFPGTHSTLDRLLLDGKAVTGYDASKIYDTDDSGAYRLELWNCFGISGSNGCAFGTRDGDVIHELAFNSSIQVDFTIRRLFEKPQW